MMWVRNILSVWVLGTSLFVGASFYSASATAAPASKVPVSTAPASESAQVSGGAAADLFGMPDVIVRGLEEYKRNGAEAAMAGWVVGGPLQSDDFVTAQADGLHRIENFYGKYQDYAPIRVLEISPRLKTVYLVMYFEKGAAFCYMLCYRTQEGRWVVSDFDGSTSPRKILPEYGAVGYAAAAGSAAEDVGGNRSSGQVR